VHIDRSVANQKIIGAKGSYLLGDMRRRKRKRKKRKRRKRKNKCK